jgi:hypothetical protein
MRINDHRGSMSMSVSINVVVAINSKGGYCWTLESDESDIGY